ncbi:T9SS type A sorting domain-containing protein [Ignavibacterium sp.]|uniref:T9SS type A sorting domain-containing protein n=1 Tax=Ignavibacterium sp. TaxID=2651167 RepID=UPI00307E6E62
MKKFTFVLLLLSSFTFSQTIVNHNTGTLTVSLFNNGYIGHNFDATQGNGVVFGSSPDAMFTAGLMFGDNVRGVNGMVGSFVQGTPQLPIIADLQNVTPFTPFTSDPNFNQITEVVMNDGLAPLQYGVTIRQKSYSNTSDKFVILTYRLTNNSSNTYSNFRVGIFADWDVGAAAYLNNRRGMDIPRNLVYQYLQGTQDPNYYGIVALSGLTGGTSTDIFPGTTTTIRNEIYLLINSIYDSTSSTRLGDFRSFVGSGPYTLSPGASLDVAFAIVVGTNLADLQSSADAAALKYNNFILPVELTSFTASVDLNGNVVLNWTTATEINNHGFEVERRSISTEYIPIGFVKGFGTTSEIKSYTFTDRNLEPGKFFYRLKQIDFNGVHEYSNEIEVEVSPVSAFSLSQNYPNPFNPSTIISWQSPISGWQTLKVYDMLGNEVAALVDEFKPAGSYNAEFTANNLSSGIYYYKLQIGSFVETKKMMLMK